MIRSRKDAAEHQRRHGFFKQAMRIETEIDPPITCDKDTTVQLTHTFKIPKRREMTRPEREMGAMLMAQKVAREILDWRFEGMRLKWGEDPKTGQAMWYKPDFVVTVDEWSHTEHPRYHFRLIEVKGPWISERDLVRFKGCRAAWPQFEFQMWQRDKDGRWTQLL